MGDVHFYSLDRYRSMLKNDLDYRGVTFIHIPYFGLKEKDGSTLRIEEGGNRTLE